MRFLIVDDDRACRELLGEILSRHAECDFAFDGSEAIDAVRLALEDGRPYDLICLDIMMPGTNGHQALESIRTLEMKHRVYGSDATKVIMTTALHDSKHCIRSFREGCEAFCTKPIREEDILEHVRQLVGELPDLPEAGTTEVPAEGAAEDAGHRRFLIVDDDPVSRALLQTMISPHGQCSLAYDGREAIDAVRLALEDDNPFDLICLDIMMPGIDGHDALRAIRQLEAESGIYGSEGVKVIMVTALHDSKHCIQSFREGCESYVTKPVDEKKLLGRMRELGVLDASQV